MLSARSAAAAAAAIFVSILTAIGMPVPAAADPSPGSGGVICPPLEDCTVIAQTPGGRGAHRTAGVTPITTGPGSSASSAGCWFGDEAVDCQHPDFGSWNAGDGCWYKPESPQPPKSDPVWQGHTDGVIYQASCMPFSPGTSAGGWVWRPDPVAGGPGAGAVPAVTPEMLAARAIRQLPIRGPLIGMAPRPGSIGLVGLPVWMWVQVTPATWGPASATASVPGLSVTATARATQVVWDMGDGHRVTCDGPGTPYEPWFGGRMSPTCGYRYDQSSARERDSAYEVTATTTWQVTWAGGGASGALAMERSSSTTARIGELQVLVRRR
jgi:hypothetical protein